MSTLSVPALASSNFSPVWATEWNALVFCCSWSGSVSLDGDVGQEAWSLSSKLQHQFFPTSFHLGSQINSSQLESGAGSTGKQSFVSVTVMDIKETVKVIFWNDVPPPVLFVPMSQLLHSRTAVSTAAAEMCDRWAQSESDSEDAIFTIIITIPPVLNLQSSSPPPVVSRHWLTTLITSWVKELI